MRRRTIAVLLGPLWIALVACSSPYDLDRGTLPGLSPDERGAIETQVTQARTDKRWTSAWNQAVQAGLAQRTFEGIAIDALEDGDGAAEDMLAEIRRKYGKLGSEARRDVTDLANRRAAGGRYERAAEIEILAADDAPTFAGAKRIYLNSPPRVAPDVLEMIAEARVDHADEPGGSAD